MGTEVLRPRDCLVERIRVSPRGCYANGNPRFRKPVVRPEQRKRFNSQTERKSHSGSGSGNGHLVMGQVTILKRGESLDSKVKANQVQPLTKSGDDLVVCGTGRLGPEPEMVPKQIRIGDLKSAAPGIRSDEYAGSAFSLSPSPRALPLPSFFNKKQVSKIVEDSATRDLRRLLRLD